MLRELAARQAYQRFAEQEPLSQSKDKTFGEISGGSQSPDANTAQSFSSQSEYIYVSDNFKVHTGAQLTANLFVGKPLGFGLQVALSGLCISVCSRETVGG